MWSIFLVSYEQWIKIKKKFIRIVLHKQFYCFLSITISFKIHSSHKWTIENVITIAQHLWCPHLEQLGRMSLTLFHLHCRSIQFLPDMVLPQHRLFRLSRHSSRSQITMVYWRCHSLNQGRMAQLECSLLWKKSFSKVCFFYFTWKI